MIFKDITVHFIQLGILRLIKATVRYGYSTQITI